MFLQVIEKFSSETVVVAAKFNELEQDLDTYLLGNTIGDTHELIHKHEERRSTLEGVSQPVFRRGESAITLIDESKPQLQPNLQILSMAVEEKTYLDGILNQLQGKYSQLIDMWEKRKKELMQCLNLKEFESGFRKVGHLYHQLVHVVCNSSI